MSISRGLMMIFMGASLHCKSSNKDTIVTRMILTLEDNSEIGGHGRSDLCYLICLMLLIR